MNTYAPTGPENTLEEIEIINLETNKELWSQLMGSNLNMIKDGPMNKTQAELIFRKSHKTECLYLLDSGKGYYICY
jgi:hypothetical protein